MKSKNQETLFLQGHWNHNSAVTILELNVFQPNSTVVLPGQFHNSKSNTFMETNSTQVLAIWGSGYGSFD